MDNLTFEPKTHTYMRADGLVVPSVTQILKATGCTQSSEFYTNEGRERGTRIHKYAEAIFNGDDEIEILSEEDFGFVNGLISFYQSGLFEVLETETLVYNKALGYCGTADLLARNAQTQEPAIIDLKTGGVVDRATALQLTGYKLAFTPLENVRLYALQCKGDGKYKLIEYTEDLTEVWKGAVQIYKWRKQNGRL